MKILCVIDSLGIGGAQHQLVELALGFKEKGHDVNFLTYYYIPHYSHVLEDVGITITCLEGSNYLKRLLRMRRFIRLGKYDAVLSFLEGANFISEAAGFPFRKWKLLVGERSAKPDLHKSLLLILYRIFHLFADYVVANSHANIEIIRSINPFLPKSKCKVIYNIIDFNIWKPSQDYFPRKNGKLKLIVAASHQSLKNLNGLVEGLSLLDNEEKNKINVEWYGDRILEPYYDRSFLEAKQKTIDLDLTNIISYHPASHQIINKIHEADAVGLFSFYEGLPNIVCEAMACRKPVICSAVSDLPGILSNDANLLCDPTNAKSIKRALSYLISLSDDQLLIIGSENEKIAKEKFNKDNRKRKNYPAT